MRGSTDKVLKDLVEAKLRLTLSFEEGKKGEMDSSSDSGESEKGIDHEQMINSLMEEIEELKQRLEDSEKKCFAVEKLFELKQNDDGDSKLDEENRMVKEQLKWKMEQFKHLEEAHEKLKYEFQTSSKNWDVARSALVDEISELKTSLETQTRISNDFETRLEMCSQALAHEESKIKILETELAESKAFYDKSFAECQEVKSELENLMVCRDEKIANLRSLLSEKEAMCKEYEYMSRKIELENQELMTSIKELQEAQIQGASSGSSSMLTRVKSKLKNFEQKHKAREAEWNSKLEKLTDELHGCRSELEVKNATIKEMSSKLEDLENTHMNCSLNISMKDDHLGGQLNTLIEESMNCKSELEAKDSIITKLKMELDECSSSVMQLKVENEETSHMLSAYKKGFAELQMKMESEKAEMERIKEEGEDTIHKLSSLLDETKKDIQRLQEELQAEREKSLGKSGSLKLSEAELERHQVMIMEMSENERYLKEQCLEMECELKERMQEVRNALEDAHIELAEASCKESEIQLEMQSWKAMAERLQSSLAECQDMRRQVEHSLLAEVEVEEELKQEMEEKERIINDLQKQIASVGLQIKTRETEAELTSVEHNIVLRSVNEKDRLLQDIQNELESLKDEVIRDPESSSSGENSEKEDIIQFIQDKEQRIEHLMERLDSLEESFDTSLNSFSIELEEKEAEISWILEAWEKIATAEKLAKLEIDEKEQMVAELEEEIHDIEKKLETQEMSFRQMEKHALDIEDVLEAKQMEMRKLTSEMKEKLNDSDALINDLRSEKMALYEDVMKLSTERENLMEYIGGLCDRINEFSNEDMQLMGMLGNMMQNFDDQDSKIRLTGNEEKMSLLLKENQNNCISPPTIKSFEVVVSGERSPFREINSHLHLGASN